jgi:hypothetical protein
MSAVISANSLIKKGLKKVASRDERCEFLTTIMRGETVGWQPHPRYPDLQVPIIPNLIQRMKACTTLGKIEGDFIVRVEHSNTVDYASELKRLKQLDHANNVYEGDFKEVVEDKTELKMSFI